MDRLAAEQSLAEFIRQAWTVLVPSAPLVWGWHIDAMCLHLEAMIAGLIRNLYIAIPPGSTKTLCCNVFFHAWVWINRPSMQFLCASQESGNATRDSLACRRLIESDWYQGNWGDRYRLTSDQNVKTWYDTSARGHRISTTVGSKVVGKKGDFLSVDDAHDAVEVESPVKCQGVLDWWDNGFYDRVNDFKKSCRLIVGQRVKVGDLPAYVMSKGEFEELHIPEEYVKARHCKTSIGWEDPRKEDGEWLRPERFGPENKQQVIRTSGEYGYAAKHQQDPVPREGAIFKAKWIKHFSYWGDAYHIDGLTYRPQDCSHFATMDPAGGVSEAADYTSIAIFAITPDNFLLLIHIDRTRTPLEDIPAHLCDVCEGWPLSLVVCEADFLQEAIARQARRLHGLPPIRSVKASDGGSKLIRAIPALAAVQAGQARFRHPTEADWWDAFQMELLAFTGGEEKNDQIDSFTWGVQEWQKGLMALGPTDPDAAPGFSGAAATNLSPGGGYRGVNAGNLGIAGSGGGIGNGHGAGRERVASGGYGRGRGGLGMGR